MFTEEQKREYSNLTPSSKLKERVMAENATKTGIPAKYIYSMATVAAALVVAIVLIVVNRIGNNPKDEVMLMHNARMIQSDVAQANAETLEAGELAPTGILLHIATDKVTTISVDDGYIRVNEQEAPSVKVDGNADFYWVIDEDITESHISVTNENTSKKYVLFYDEKSNKWMLRQEK